jgi:hypothetical protein
MWKEYRVWLLWRYWGQRRSTAEGQDAVPKPRPARRKLGSVILLLLGAVVALGLVHGRPSSASSAPTSPGPWYCDQRIVPSGDDAAKALRDCPQFAPYRARVAYGAAQIRAEGGTPPPPVWAGLP